MSYYELRAEQRGYCHFYHREQEETPAHFHSSIELLFVEEGELPVTIDGNVRILKRGEGVYCDSFSVHRYLSAKEVVSYSLLGQREYFKRAIALLGDATPQTFFRFDNFDLLHQMYAFYQENYKNAGGRYATFEGIVNILFAEIAKCNPLQPLKEYKKNTLVCDVLQYAEENPQADLSLAAIAQRVGYSHEYLSRVLHKYLMENWNTYVNRLRVRLADTYLKAYPEKSVLEVAYACGFESPNTFYRAYKKEFAKKPKRDKNVNF